MDLARQRRNYTLRRMAAEGFITQAEADLTRAEPVVLAERTVRSNTVAPYFLEEVRQHLEKEYGAERLYEQGLTVHTTLDARLQGGGEPGGRGWSQSARQASRLQDTGAEHSRRGGGG